MKKQLLTLCFLAAIISAHGQAGSHDLSLNGTGKFQFQSPVYNFESFAIQADNKMVMASKDNNPDVYRLCRILENGGIDSSFGTYGYQYITITANGDYPGAIAVQADGKIIVAGYSINNGGGVQYIGSVVRLLPDGSPDSSFALNGKRLINFGTVKNFISQINFQSDGKILLGGSGEVASTPLAAVMRLNTDGSTDSTFGISGRYLGINNGEFRGIIDMKVQADDKIVCLNVSANQPTTPFSCFRLMANGVVDNSFGTNGTVSTTFGTQPGFCRSLDIQADGKIVVTGSVAEPGIAKMGVIRYSSNGVLDNSFGTAGKVIIAGSTNYLEPQCVKIQPADQKIIVAAAVGTNLNAENFKTYRLKPNGTIDNEFGTNGAVQDDFNGFEDAPAEIFILNDGRIYVAGLSAEPTSSFYDFYNSFARYNSCGINVTSQPVSITKTKGTNAQFTVGSSSPSATYQWQKQEGSDWQNLSNGGQYSGVTSATLTISNLTLANNQYTYRAIATSGLCTDTSNVAIITVEQSNSIDDINSNIAARVYPNPVSEKLFVELKDVKYIGQSYSITDVAGKVIITGTLENLKNTIDVSAFSHGVYFLKITEGISLKFVK